MHQKQEIIQFFQKLLREGSPCDLREEYPLAFGNPNLEVINLNEASGFENIHLSAKNPTALIVNSAKNLKAGLIAHPRRIRISEEENRIFLFVGSVVTHPDFRQQGLQRHLFEALSVAAAKTEIAGMILWSNQIQFYEKLGFFLGGLQATWSSELNFPLTEDASAVRVAEASSVEFKEAWFKGFQSKTLQVERTEEEMSLLFKIPRMKVFYTDQAYALVGKGEDFKLVCHEWAGPAGEVLQCFEKMRQENKRIFVLSPGVIRTPDEILVAKTLEAKSYEARLEYLGLFKCFDPKFTAESMDPKALKYPFFIWGLDSI